MPYMYQQNRGTEKGEDDMKKAILAIALDTKITKEEMNEISQYALSKGAELTGQLEYPKEIALLSPYALLRAFRATKADIVISDDPMLFIGEISRDGKLSKDLKKDGVEIYCRNLDMTIEELMYKVRKDLEKDIDEHVKNMIDHAELIKEDRPGVMLFASPEHIEHIDDYIDSLHERERLGDAFTIEMDGPSENPDDLRKLLHKIVQKENIQKFIVVDECHSKVINRFLDEMKEKKMDVVYDLDACQSESLAKTFGNLFMN